MCVCVCVCVCVWGREYREVTESCNPSDVGAENLAAPLEEQEMFLSTEPSLQICTPSFKIFFQARSHYIGLKLRSGWPQVCDILLPLPPDG